MFTELFIFGILCIFANSTENTFSTDNANSETTTFFDLSSTTFGDCDDVNNCTQLNVTSESPSNDKNNGKENKRQKTAKQMHPKYVCTCNLQDNICDINCCCDPDCSAKDKTVFKFCELDENRHFDDRYCNYIKYMYVNNTPFEWEVNQKGLFCVVSSNIPKSHLVQTEKPIKSKDLPTPQIPFWRKDIQPHLHMGLKLGVTNYIFGDSLMIVKNDSTVDFLRIPNRFLTEPCIFQQDVFYLKDDKHICTQANLEEQANPLLSFTSFFQDFKVIGNPKLINWKAKGIFFQSCPRNICIEIEPKLCDVHLNNCYKLENATGIKFHCSFNLRENLNICKNAVRKIHYKFYHNGTSGLQKIEILGVLSNFSYRFGGEHFQLTQDYSVEFLWINQTRNYSQIFSGNPGYIIGKPILIGTKAVNGSVHRNSSNFIDNFMVFPENVDGKCTRNDTNNIPLSFGYNLRTSCRTDKILIGVKQTNATEICRNIQEAIFDLWGIPKLVNQSLLFGLFGNALTNVNEDWGEVLYDTDINRTTGSIVNKNTTLVCCNISTLLNVEIFYSRVDLETVSNQHKILGIAFDFYHNWNRTYLLKGKNDIHVPIHLISQVSFRDITSKKKRKFADSPSFDIRLPYDFFYPFIKVDNGSNLNMPNMVLVVLVFAFFRN